MNGDQWAVLIAGLIVCSVAVLPARRPEAPRYVAADLEGCRAERSKLLAAEAERAMALPSGIAPPEPAPSHGCRALLRRRT